MRVHANIPIGEIAASTPGAAQLLDLFNIDYVCHGQLTLREACDEADADPALVRRALEQLPRGAGTRWADLPVQKLLDELRNDRHPRLHHLMTRTATLLAETRPTADTLRLRDAFTIFADLIGPHMTREEHMLFPVIQHLEDCWTKNEPVTMNFVGGVRKPVAALVLDHARIIDAVKAMQSAAEVLRGDGAAALVDAVDELTHEVREHIHIENNVLYPRVTALEAGMQAAVAR